MDDYIERKAALAVIDKIKDADEIDLVNARLELEDIPSADVAPVRHGEWKWSHGGECSVCGYRNSDFEYNYCPNCGAKMEVGGDV